jgi:hypothetical protein
VLAILPLILSIAPEIARWIGGGQAGAVTSAVTSAVQSITGTQDPEAAAAAIAADPAKAAELRVQLAKIAADAETAQRQADLDALKAQFADDASKRQAELDSLKASISDIGSARDESLSFAKIGSPLAWGAPVLSIVIVLAFGIMLYVVCINGVESGSQSIANVLLGTLAAMATQVANFWLGSSSGSQKKDISLDNAQNRLAQSIPAHMLPQPAAVVPATDAAAGLAGLETISADALNALSLERMQMGRP